MGSVITVQVGTPPTPFTVHESLVVARSGFFKGALNGYFKESHTRTAELPEDDRWLFTCVIHWLYTGTLKMVLTSESEAGERVNLTSNNPNTQDQNDQEQDDECSLSFPKFLSWNRRVQQLFELWIYADKLQVPDLQNDLIIKLIELGEGTSDWIDCTPMPSDETMEFVYDNLSLTHLSAVLPSTCRFLRGLRKTWKTLSRICLMTSFETSPSPPSACGDRKLMTKTALELTSPVHYTTPFTTSARRRNHRAFQVLQNAAQKQITEIGTVTV